MMLGAVKQRLDDGKSGVRISDPTEEGNGCEWMESELPTPRKGTMNVKDSVSISDCTGKEHG